MLVKTTVKFKGCPIWLESNTSRDAKHAAARLQRWFIDHIGETSLFIKDQTKEQDADNPKNKSK